MDWAKAPQKREQLVMFTRRLDDAIAPDHVVRLLDEILGRIDWSGWEAAYDLMCGQPPIHPRVIAGVILYGLLTRIRSTRPSKTRSGCGLTSCGSPKAARSTIPRSASFASRMRTT